MEEVLLDFWVCASAAKSMRAMFENCDRVERITRASEKLEAAKQWLKDRNGGSPGCLDRFMKWKGL